MTAPTSDGRSPAPRSRFATLIGFNGLAQVAPIVVVFALTPVLVSRLGLDRFGIWSLALIALSTLTSLDGGVSASLARFFAIYAARSERSDSGRLLLGSYVLYLLLGLVLTVASFALAPILVPLLHIPAQLEPEAIWVFRWLPLLAILGLVADSVAALLQGNGQFQALAGATCVSVGVFAVAVLVLVQPGAHLGALFLAVALRYVAMAATGLLLARRHLTVGRRLLPSWPAVREVGSYASRMQLAALSGFVNAELDGFVIAAVAPVGDVGLYSIGLQAASAARSVPLYAFSPLLTRLTTTFRHEGRAAAAMEFEQLERRWLPSVLGFGVVAVAAIGFSVPVWLGDRLRAERRRRGHLADGLCRPRRLHRHADVLCPSYRSPGPRGQILDCMDHLQRASHRPSGSRCRHGRRRRGDGSHGRRCFRLLRRALPPR